MRRLSKIAIVVATVALAVLGSTGIAAADSVRITGTGTDSVRITDTPDNRDF